MLNRLTGLPPLWRENANRLVLGSFPGARSLELRVYYGNPHNHFWRIIGNAYGIAVPQLYEDRCELLQGKGIAAWDVYASCERDGSLDQDIRNPEANDIAGFLATHPGIERVLVNGTKAYAAFAGIMKTNGLPMEPPGPATLAHRDGDAETTPGEDTAQTVEIAGRAIRVYKLPSTSPVPSRRYRRAEDKFEAWKTALL